MKDNFPGYYRPTKDEFIQLWNDSIFVLETNVLLNMYRYTPKTRKEFISILEKISDRIWIPYQVALEYHKNRLSVINQQILAYEKIEESLDNNKNRIKNELDSYSLHPYIEVKSYITKIEEKFAEIKEELNKDKKKHPNLLDDDEIRKIITMLFEGKVGSSCSQDVLKKIYKKGVERFEKNIPPGYRDKDKDGLEKYGDLILWYQIINHAKSIKKPIILITDEKKDDWWLKFNGKIISPHPELINEMFFKGGTNFYMYKTAKFMEYAKKHFESQIDQKSIDEVRDIEKSDKKSIGLLLKAVNDFSKQMTEYEMNLPLVKAINDISKQMTEYEMNLPLVKAINDISKQIDEYKKNLALVNSTTILGPHDLIADFQSNDSDEQSDTVLPNSFTSDQYTIKSSSRSKEKNL